MSFDGKSLSKMIREKKKQGEHSDYRADMDYAGQDAVDPNTAWDEKQNMEVNEALDNPDHEPASPAEMGENESSQDKAMLKKTMERINKYFDSMGI
jgi:hypothetical protein